MIENIQLYTDGAARGNPGAGGYGIVLIWGQHIKELSQGYRHTTNNRMELLAVIAGLQSIKNSNYPITVYSDSQYVVNAVQKGWLHTWIKTNFKGGKKNADLWIQYHQIAANFSITFVWVKGHANNKYNNRCDELATAAADNKSNLLVDTWYENNAV
jgi:ribonuclease HI